eukprot:TRINITY_DN872_c3_g1_i1.p1 TRINITY_DN872_c3_g1~~TRINITY_DN872_c3_g1_i1.p1  ORF type:complete len:689 (+),score=154.98 TRINITY_DN872_c3_g1_i1:55-2067(+)
MVGANPNWARFADVIESTPADPSCSGLVADAGCGPSTLPLPRYWAGRQGPYSAVIRLPPQRSAPIQYAGWMADHDDSMNPRVVVINAGTAPSNASRMIKCQALPGTGVQLWLIPDGGISAEQSYVRFDFLDTFAGQASGIGAVRLLLFSEEPKLREEEGGRLALLAEQLGVPVGDGEGHPQPQPRRSVSMCSSTPSLTPANSGASSVTRSAGPASPSQRPEVLARMAECFTRLRGYAQRRPETAGVECDGYAVLGSDAGADSPMIDLGATTATVPMCVQQQAQPPPSLKELEFGSIPPAAPRLRNPPAAPFRTHAQDTSSVAAAAQSVSVDATQPSPQRRGTSHVALQDAIASLEADVLKLRNIQRPSPIPSPSSGLRAGAGSQRAASPRVQPHPRLPAKSGSPAPIPPTYVRHESGSDDSLLLRRSAVVTRRQSPIRCSPQPPPPSDVGDLLRSLDCRVARCEAAVERAITLMERRSTAHRQLPHPPPPPPPPPRARDSFQNSAVTADASDFPSTELKSLVMAWVQPELGRWAKKIEKGVVRHLNHGVDAWLDRAASASVERRIDTLTKCAPPVRGPSGRAKPRRGPLRATVPLPEPESTSDGLSGASRRTRKSIRYDRDPAARSWSTPPPASRRRPATPPPPGARVRRTDMDDSLGGSGCVQRRSLLY